MTIQDQRAGEARATDAPTPAPRPDRTDGWVFEDVPLTASSWREHALTRIAETGTLVAVFARQPDRADLDVVAGAARRHLAGAYDAARMPTGVHAWLSGSAVERTMTHLDAAEADTLRMAPDSYLRGLMPTLLAQARHHLPTGDPRRARMEDIARGARDRALAADERDAVVTCFHGAASAARREIMRVRSFRNVLLACAAALFGVVALLGIVGGTHPNAMPLCFNPDGRVICPTQQTVLGPSVPSAATAGTNVGAGVDAAIRRTTTPWDVPLVLIVGMVAAGVAAAGALKNIRGTSTPYALPVALAVLKLPTGALTAYLGLLLMRGQFVPGLSALDFPAQIIAWAVVFGYAQQIFTRLVDQQAHAVLNDVGGSTDKPSTG